MADKKTKTTHEVKRLVRVWFSVATKVAQSQLLTSWGGIVFLIGKIARFILFFIFLTSILGRTASLANFSKEEVITFFLVFNLIDILTQFLFRGVYVFRQHVVKGTFDLDLLKPLPALFRPIFGWTDIFDAITLIPLIGFLAYYTASNDLIPSFSAVLLFVLMLANAIIIGFAFHLFVASIAILTTEIDHLVWIYRDITNVARFPTDIYTKTVQYVLTFTIPVVVLITIPAKSLIGLLNINLLVTSYVVSAIFLVGSFLMWRTSLKRYTSASS